MKRRNFLKSGVKGSIASGLLLSSNSISAKDKKSKDNIINDGSRDNWKQLSDGKRGKPERFKEVNYKVVVVGGGLAGICAAVASAREGVETLLVQDRSVLGGNASSEIRVLVNGVNHLKPDWIPERETGIIEEILLHNRFNNPQESFSVWDHVLYDFVIREPHLELLLNTQAVNVEMTGSSIKKAICWQNSTETEYHISAQQFVDCSGDGLLAASAGAEYRTGREAGSEFNEKYAPEEADGWQMGASLLIAGKDMGKPTAYSPPSFAIPFDLKKSNPRRKVRSFNEGYWWVEVGSKHDIIAEQDEIQHKLMGYVHGVWDYIKNSGDFEGTENYALEWIGSVPGRRESRRFMGDHILSERDLVDHQHFDDAVAYGGWSLDEHNPGGIENLDEPPSYFHYHFKKVYQIPFRSLYSRNIDNLLFSGRNISQTHIALSSTRVMATCALMGQATGTAAALCVQHKKNPRGIYQKHMVELQEKLMLNDAFIPDHPAMDKDDLAKEVKQWSASSTQSGDVNLLNDGWSRDFKGVLHHWSTDQIPASVQMEWEKPVALSSIVLKCDTNVQMNIMMRNNYNNRKIFTDTVPPELLKDLNLEARINGKWVTIGTITDNKTRRIKFNFDTIKTTSLRVNINETYGSSIAKLFEVRAYEKSVIS
ncbi:FAD-dependent oxidoreductase [Flammeovirga agarivorans]|uniref:FAD-dependent oxidoreductase n=1 Tax=Flammeovirga agarivorans TaxID=2726742 RepID=A0A7X8SND9_9BACT|nr:FAD-dependent oxidoreductase [Flammeovirga agarivorans]NLR93418.1 FAD-dependent oxidoreductase [Flammeovirga agarivorans]